MKKVIIADDHMLICKSLTFLINEFVDFEVDSTFQNGRDLVFRLQDASLPSPDLILLDVRMPIMGGIETMEWIAANKPHLPVLVLTMEDDDFTIIKMLRNGARGYLLKDSTPQVLEQAFNDILSKGMYYTERITKILLTNANSQTANGVHLRDKELEFIKLACSELTYKEIAETMSLSPKTIDGYRENIFEKLDIKSRTGLVMFAIKNRIVIM
jgi:DNA-binding NarL/FixJ family response regulator